MYCFSLNTNIHPLKYPFDPTPRPYGHDLLPISDVSDELVAFLAQRGMKVGHAEIFHKPAGFRPTAEIHIDVERGDFTKLNWVWGGEDSLMCWYKEKNPNIIKEVELNPEKTRYLGFQADEVILDYQECLQGPCVIQAGEPHNVIMGKSARHALSLVLVDANLPLNWKNRRRIGIEEAYNLFKDIAILKQV
jgi:hypothetical protein